MPQKPNKLVRILVPIALVVVAIGVLAAIAVNQQRTAQRGAPAAAQRQQEEARQREASRSAEAAGERAAGEAGAGAEEPAEERADGAPPPGPPSIEVGEPPAGLHARVIESGAIEPVVLGAETQDSPHVIRLEVSPFGAGVRSLHLTRYFESIEKAEWTRLQHERVLTHQEGTRDPRGAMVTPFAALHVEIGGQRHSLAGSVSAPVWREIDGRPGAYEAFIDDAEGDAVLRVERAWVVEPGSYVVTLEQRIENLSDRPIELEYRQLGPTDLPKDSVTYGGDKRRWRFGYLEKPSLDPDRQTVLGEAFATQGRGKILGGKSGGLYEPVETIWPNTKSTNRQLELVWAGATSRYFAVAAHPLVATDVPKPTKTFGAVATVDRIVPNPAAGDAMDALIAMRLNSGPRTVPAGGTLDLSMGVYAGPLSEKVIGGQPIAAAAGLEKLIYHSFGGPCAFCTFQWLTGLLLMLLRFLHDYVVFDWALSIIVLVLIVRTCLHPITRWSQVRMQRFGKQMQAMAPKQKKIQEKYKDDQKRMQQEMAKLMREEGINPAGMLGCLPMFLQTPIWIALYATLYFAVDLQHVPAFFGVVQNLVPLHWPVLGHFLGDLSEPDRFVYFGSPLITVPLMGEISSFNILPILLGVVFFLHQKYLTPPTSGSLTPEQEQQQKIMKIMMVVMFPIIMYNAPSGLALYFICNSTLGIIESRHIRQHAEKHGLLEPKKREPGKPGFLGRMMELAEQQRKMQAQAQQRRPGQGPGGPKGPAQRRPKSR